MPALKTYFQLLKSSVGSGEAEVPLHKLRILNPGSDMIGADPSFRGEPRVVTQDTLRAR